MRPAVFVIPGDIDLPTGGYGYDRKVLAAARASGFDLAHLAIPGGYPHPSPEVLAESAARIAATPENAVLLVDGLAYGAMPEAMIRAFNRPVVELCHHPLALEPGTPPEISERLARSERAAMRLVRHVIVTSPLTATIVARDFGVAADRITVALPGTERAPRARGSGGPGVRLLAVGSVIPRKAYHDLVDALALLPPLDWTLDIVGSRTLSPDTVEALHKQIQAAGLADRIRLCGAMDASGLAQAYDGADVFVMSSLFEGYGMVITEALARGLPIVSTTGGALAETLPDSAGLKVPPGSPQELGKMIHRMITSHSERSSFSDGAWRAAQLLPDWTATARIIRDVLERVAP